MSCPLNMATICESQYKKSSLLELHMNWLSCNAHAYRMGSTIPK